MRMYPKRESKRNKRISEQKDIQLDIAEKVNELLTNIDIITKLKEQLITAEGARFVDAYVALFNVSLKITKTNTIATLNKQINNYNNSADDKTTFNLIDNNNNNIPTSESEVNINDSN